MMTLSSPHVHTQYCDGKSPAEETVKTALALGFVSLGFSSHARQDFDLAYAMDAAKEQAYILEIRALQTKYAGRIRIWLGMERDARALSGREPYDYVIGSAHYLPGADGEMVAVDGPKEAVCRLVDSVYAGDGLAYAEAYYEMLGQYISAYRPDIIGHFDLIMKNNRAGELFDPAHPRALRAAQRAMEAALSGCALMEVNTGAIARSGAQAPYPSLPLLTAWKELGGQVILASDCHDARQLNTGYAQGVRLIKQAGFREALVLGRGGALFERCAVPETE